MRRHWSQRLLATLGAVWFVLIGIEPAVFGACPAHGVAGASAVHAGHSMSTVAHRGTASGHDAGAPAPHEPHQCTCPGSCCGPSVVDVPSVQPALALVATLVTPPRPTAHEYRAAWTDFVLPFATAPPQSSRGAGPSLRSGQAARIAPVPVASLA